MITAKPLRQQSCKSTRFAHQQVLEQNIQKEFSLLMNSTRNSLVLESFADISTHLRNHLAVQHLKHCVLSVHKKVISGLGLPS